MIPFDEMNWSSLSLHCWLNYTWLRVNFVQGIWIHHWECEHFGSGIHFQIQYMDLKNISSNHRVFANFNVIWKVDILRSVCCSKRGRYWSVHCVWCKYTCVQCQSKRIFPSHSVTRWKSDHVSSHRCCWVHVVEQTAGWGSCRVLSVHNLTAVLDTSIQQC